MTRFVFKSLAEPNNRRYVVSANRLSDNLRNGNQFLSDRIGFFETYGDGDTQHCPLGQVSTQMFTDFCASATAYMLDNLRGAEDMARILASEMRSYKIHHSAIRGAMTIKYKEGKRKYVNRNEWQVSSADSKRHDKRWDEVVQWMDGGYLSLVGLLRIGSGCFLLVYNELTILRNAYYELTGEWSKRPAEVLEWLHWEYGQQSRAEEAFHALKAFCDAVESKDQAKRAFDCYVSNCENDKRLAAEVAAQMA